VLRERLDRIIDVALTNRRLLEHPFYRRWEAGGLTRPELADYASQYRHFEAALPDVLVGIAAGLDDTAAAAAVRANLADELGQPEPHLSLFDDFLTAVGGRSNEPATASTRALVTEHRELAARSPVAALAALAAYEVQAGAIAATKASGLRSHYGLGEVDTRFWDVHATAEPTHAEWTLDALATEAGDDGDAVRRGATAAADRWWSFLDDRQAAATT
jgi:pyrroloquinoline-quinone synthase